MVHSVELLFDTETDAALRRCWADLARAGLPSAADVHAATNRPHVTVVVAERIDPAADDEALSGLLQRFPLDITIGAPVCFGSRRWTLARQLVPTTALLELHAAVAQACGPYLSPKPAPHTGVGEWTPHVTLGRRYDAAQLGRALAKVPALSRDLSGQLVGLRRWDGERRVEQLLGPQAPGAAN